MIISASRRTDIPAFYGDWLVKRLQAGFVLVANPYNSKQISRISLQPAEVDCLVLWSKDFRPLLKHIDILKQYSCLFHFTINAYGVEIEPGTAEKQLELMTCLQTLAEEFGKETVIWRYDPIIISQKYNLDFHCRVFEELCSNLANNCRHCVISFLDEYKSVSKKLQLLKLRAPEKWEEDYLAEHFHKIAMDNNLLIKACAERDLSKWQIQPSACIDQSVIEEIIGNKIKCKKTKPERELCNCCYSRDIGRYGTCQHGCVYCYASACSNKSTNNQNFNQEYSEILS